MARFIKDRSESTGKAPGSLIFIGRKKMDKPIIHVMDYNADYLDEFTVESIEEVKPYLEKNSVTWINIFGIHDTELIHKVGKIFNINNLFLEDMMDTDQMPKYDDGYGYDGFIMKMLEYDAIESQIHTDQISLILGKNYVLTLQEMTAQAFNPVRDRIRNHKGRVRLNDNDYLMYALMDTLADQYLNIVVQLAQKVEEMESQLFDESKKDLSQRIYRNKTELSYLRKNIRPLKDIMFQVMKSEHTFFTESTRTYLTDLNDIVNQVNESIELYNNMVSDQLNIHNTVVNNKMNEVMKVLTIFASIFIPLTFIAGVYGMNFEYIPELQYRNGYFVFWGCIIVIGLLLVYYFKRKNWL